MTFRGSIQKGVVVFDHPVPLEDGTEVEVATVSSTDRPKRGSPEAMQLLKGITWSGPPGEIQRLLAQVQEMRDADLTPDGMGR